MFRDIISFKRGQITDISWKTGVKENFDIKWKVIIETECINLEDYVI